MIARFAAPLRVPGSWGRFPASAEYCGDLDSHKPYRIRTVSRPALLLRRIAPPVWYDGMPEHTGEGIPPTKGGSLRISPLAVVRPPTVSSLAVTELTRRSYLAQPERLELPQSFL